MHMTRQDNDTEDSEDHIEPLDDAQAAAMLALLQLSTEDIAAGRTRPAREVIAELKAKLASMGASARA